MRSFAPPYDKNEVEEDLAYVERVRQDIEAKGEDENKKYADVLEGLAFYGINNAGWFGADSRVRQTSPYDDYKNGIDLIAEFKDGGVYAHQTGLAIDATFGNEQVIAEKIKRIETDIQKGTLSRVKYFETENYKGMLENVPRVIVGISRAHVAEMARLWNDPRERERLQTHPAQRVFLRETLRQLEYFTQVAKRSEQSQHLVPIFEQDAEVVRSIARQKSVEGVHIDPYSDDRVLGTILKHSEDKINT